MSAGAIDAITHAVSVLHGAADAGAVERRYAENLHEAKEKLVALISIAGTFDRLLGGRSIPDNLTVHNVQVHAMDFYRLQEALKAVRGEA